jgi:inner membrane protein
MLCAVLPDADVLTFAFGVPYGSMFGHRGLTHSLAFALLLAFAVVALFFRDEPNRKALVLFFFLATASHGALDALTNGGLGVAFFAPFSGARYFFPFRPVVVSPIGVGSFFSEWGLAVIESELLWVWLPAGAVVSLVLIFRRLRGRQPKT